MLAQLARARARRKLAELEAALEGAEFFTAEHAALLAAMLARIDRVNAEIARLSEAIERLLAPYEEQLQQAESMPGWGRRAAEDALAETGTDMTRFRTGAHLASWRTRWTTPPASARGRPSPRRATGTSAACSARPPSPPAKPRPAKAPGTGGCPAGRGKAKALVAVGNTQLKVYHTLLSSPGMQYQDLGPDYYERRAEARRQVRHHVGKLGALGFDVTLCRIPGPDEPAGTGNSQTA